MCKSAFGEIVKCGPTSEMTSGGNLTLGSGVYSMQPYTHLGEHICGTSEPHLWLHQEQTLKNIEKFCTHFDGEKIQRGKEESDNYFPTVGGVMSTMKVKWYDKTIGCSEGDFRDTEYTIDRVSSSLCLMASCAF